MVAPVLALIALFACLPPMDEEALETNPLGALELPAPEVPLPVPEDVAEAAHSAARASGIQPTDFGPGRLLAPPDPDKPWTWSLYHQPPQVEGHPEVDSFDLLWTREPYGTVEGEELVLRWETRWPTPRGSFCYALRLEEDPLAPPRYLSCRPEDLEGESTTHEAHIPFSSLLRPVHDADGVVERGWGEVAWRVQSRHRMRGVDRLYEGRTAFRLEGEQPVQTPTITLGPFVDQLVDDHAVIWFETDVPTAAAVAVGDSAPVVSAEPSTRHELPIHGLSPAQVHVYQVAVSDGERTTLSPYNTLRTHEPGAPVVLAMASDSRSGAGSGEVSLGGVNAATLHPLLVDAARRGAEAVVFPGDLVDGYTTRADHFTFQLRNWLRITEGVHASLPMYTTMGNHEAVVRAWSDRVQIDDHGQTEASFAEVMVNPLGGPEPEVEGAPSYDETAYSFDLEGVHVAVINTNYWYAEPVGHERLQGRGNREGFLMDGQLAWLEADLQAARERGARHLIVAGHEPAFPIGGHLDDAMWWDDEHEDVNAMRERFWRILSDNHVLAYFSGDEHAYARALIGPETVEGAEHPVWSILSGGCGAPWYALHPPAAYADRVVAFSAQQHYTLWTFEEDAVRLQAIGLTGEILDDVVLTEDTSW